MSRGYDNSGPWEIDHPDVTPSCMFPGCTKEAEFWCGRCGNQYYCDSDHAHDDWYREGGHMEQCNADSGRGLPPYIWNSPNMDIGRRFLVSDMLEGEDQPMDPPDEYDHIIPWWK